MGPVMLSATYGEFQMPVADTSSTDRGNATGITFSDVAGVYTAGPLMVSLNATVFGAVGAYKAVDGTVRTRLAGTYDAGVAKLGLGYQTKTGGSADQYVASMAVPMGNFMFGLDYTARAAQGAFDNTPANYADLAATAAGTNLKIAKEDGTKLAATGAYAAYALGGSREGDKASSSVGVGMTYSFSKSTTLNFSYITYNDVGANEKFGAPVTAAAPKLNPFDGTTVQAGKTANLYPTTAATGPTPAQLDTEYRIRLMKAF
jgi:hypothetical protein